VDLVAAGGAVGDDECVGGRNPQGGEQRQLGHLQRHSDDLALIAERARHAAAGGFFYVEIPALRGGDFVTLRNRPI
jgi:hypothetical protein